MNLKYNFLICHLNILRALIIFEWKSIEKNIRLTLLANSMCTIMGNGINFGIYYDTPKSSGYVIFWVWFGGSETRKNSIYAHLATEGGDQKNLWIGQDAHSLRPAIWENNFIGSRLTRFPLRAKARWLTSRMIWIYSGDVQGALNLVKGWDFHTCFLVRRRLI